MAKTYKKISGTWYPIKKIFKRISGTWSEVKKLYKKVSGTWQVVHSGALEYTFSSSLSNVVLSSYVNPALADEFIITINSGVTISGTNGATGAGGGSFNGSSGYTYGSPARTCANGTGSGNYYYLTSNGGTGGTGSVGLNLTGFGGKKITINNNGTIRGGNGGQGGMGSSQTPWNTAICSGGFGPPWGHWLICALGGGGGSGGVAIYNPNGATLTLNGNAPINGSNGSSGSNGYAPTGTGCSCG